MKKLILLVFFSPVLSFAQLNDTIDLKLWKCPAKFINKTESTVKSVEVDEDGGMPAVEVRFDNGEKLTVISLKKPMTITLVKSTFAKILKGKQEGFKIKAIVNTGNKILIERKYNDGRETIYKCIYLVANKGKEYMIESTEVGSLEEAQKLMLTAESIKFN